MLSQEPPALHVGVVAFVLDVGLGAAVDGGEAVGYEIAEASTAHG